MPPTPRAAAELDLIRAVRDCRFANGIRCPHCGSERVIGWGGFSDRKRYRCNHCRRTFSDLTKTVYSYAKRLACWPAFHLMFRDAATVRDSAARLGVHLTSTFRWRHALLRTMCARETTQLSGVVEMKVISLAESHKGSRRVDLPRSRGARMRIPEWYETPHVEVYLMLSRAGETMSFALLPGGVDLATSVRKHLAGRCCVVGRPVRAGPIGARIQSAGHRYVMLRGAGGRFAPTWKHHLTNVEQYGTRFTVWLERFRGVASKYLDHYLAWHRLVDTQVGQAWSAALIYRAIRPPP